jgi:hypothetical protein
LPILYYDASNVVALFSASATGAERLLRGTGLVPELGVLGDGTSALAALAFYQYRDTSLGAYHEVGTAILARPRDARARQLRGPLGLAELFAPMRWRTTGLFVVDLPVTTAAADAAGRDIWGYPKFVTDISFLLRGRDVESTVYEPGPTSGAHHAPIVTLRGQAGPGVRVPSPSLVTYTMLDGRLLRTCIDVRGSMNLRFAGSVKLEVGPCAHRMAENLRTLGLARARPAWVLETDRFQSRLPAGAVA